MKIWFRLLSLFVMTPSVFAQKNMLITYHSETGNGHRMAEAVAEGAHSVED